MTEEDKGSKKKKKFTEIVVKEFTDIGRYKVRIVKSGKDSDPVVDVREYIDSEGFTGFTRKGVRLQWDALMSLEKILPELIKEMENTK